jgi:hypothetical protein
MTSAPITKPTFKERAHELVDQLPDDAGWRELIYRASVSRDIEEALRESDAGRVTELEEVMQEFALTRE